MCSSPAHIHTCSAELPTAANWWNQAKCPSMSKWTNKTWNTIQQPGAKRGHTPALGPDTWHDSPMGRFRMGKLRGRSRPLPRAEQGLSLTRRSRPARVGGVHALLLTAADLLSRNINCSFTRRRGAHASHATFTPNTPGRKKTSLFKTQTETLPQAACWFLGPAQAKATSPGAWLSLGADPSCRSA